MGERILRGNIVVSNERGGVRVAIEVASAYGTKRGAESMLTPEQARSVAHALVVCAGAVEFPIPAPSTEPGGEG